MTRKASLIGELKARRQTLGWSLKELAERCAIEEKFLAEWEHGGGSPRLDAIETWAAALGLKMAVIAAEEESRRGLSVDWQNRRVAIDGMPVRLTPMEWKALERLAAVPGELVTHQALFCHLYGEDRPYRPDSTAIRVLITKLRRVLPPLRIEAQWGRGYVISGIDPSTGGATAGATGPGEPSGQAGASERPAPSERAPSSQAPRNPVRLRHERSDFAASAIRRPAALPTRVVSRRAEELGVIERFLAERGVTRCPDIATIQKSPLPTLVWDKLKRKWVRPPMPGREAG